VLGVETERTEAFTDPFHVVLVCKSKTHCFLKHLQWLLSFLPQKGKTRPRTSKLEWQTLK